MTTFTNLSKNKMSASYLLKEDTDFLLLEDGSKIILNDSMTFDNDSKNSNTFTNQSKN
jgi:hypothetical protein